MSTYYMKMAPRRGSVHALQPWDIVKRVADYVKNDHDPYLITAEVFGQAVAVLLKKFKGRTILEDFKRGFDKEWQT